MLIADCPYAHSGSSRQAINFPDDEPEVMDRFWRYLYSLNSDILDEQAMPSILPLDQLHAITTLFATADKYGAPNLKLRTILRLQSAPYDDHADKGFQGPRGECQSIMSQAHFLETRGNLIRVVFDCNVPGIEEIQREVVNELQTGWLPDLMKLAGLDDILRDCG